MLSPLTIKFFIDGKAFALRSWHAAPRVGDEIMFGPSNQKKAYQVTRVVWGVEGPEEDALHRQAVNIEIEEIE